MRRLCRLILPLFLTLAPAFAQTTAGLAPPPTFQPLDNSGRTIPGGCLFTYAAGTTTPLATYTDSTGGVANANPITLDAGGRANVWLGSSAYKFNVTTAPLSGICTSFNFGSSVYTVDGITAPTLASASITIPNGQSFTMAGGSTSSISTNWLSGINLTYDLGSTSKYWRNLYIGNIVVAAANTYDMGTSSVQFRNLYIYNTFQNQFGLCGVSGTFSTNCWTWVPTVDGGTNSFLTLKDETNTTRLSLSVKVSGVSTNNATFGFRLLPLADATYDLGCSACGPGSTQLRWGNGFFSSNLTVNGSSLVNGTSTTGGFITSGGAGIGLQLNSGAYINSAGSVFASLPSASVGSVIWCTDCSVATPCAGGGSGAFAFRVNGPAWKCPF